MTPAYKNKNITFGEAFIICSPFLVLAFYKLSNFLGIKTICIWKLLTGHNCLGCGITRAIVCLLKGDFMGAIEYNPLVIVVFPLLLYIWGEYIYKTVKRIKETKQL